MVDLPSIHETIRNDDPQTGTPEGKPWSWSKRLAFRFAFVYLVLYILPFPLGIIPYTEFLAEWYAEPWNALVGWVGRNVLHLSRDIVAFENGSGDDTFSYVLVLCFVVLSVAISVLWSLLDRRRNAYPRLLRWLRLYVRFSLGKSMIGYGSYKVIQSQFPAPTLGRLLQPFGDASPMGLLWTFMGASQGYNVFTGGGELLGGLLLFFCRTTTLGALVCIGVLINVVMLNFCYDVPVKLYSLHLLAMSVFLLLPDVRRLANVLVLNRPTVPRPLLPLFGRRGLHFGALALRTLFLALVLYTSLKQSYDQYRSFADVAQTLPQYGLWEVDEFTLDGQVRPLLLTDQERWRRVVFDSPYALSVHMMDGGRKRFRMNFDAEKKTLDLVKRDDPNVKALFTIEQPQPALMTLAGELEGRKIQVQLRRVDAPQFRLTTRGFHWINEFPYNM